jgi:hypothetical protein
MGRSCYCYCYSGCNYRLHLNWILGLKRLFYQYFQNLFFYQEKDFHEY